MHVELPVISPISLNSLLAIPNLPHRNAPLSLAPRTSLLSAPLPPAPHPPSPSPCSLPLPPFPPAPLSPASPHRAALLGSVDALVRHIVVKPDGLRPDEALLKVRVDDPSSLQRGGGTEDGTQGLAGGGGSGWLPRISGAGRMYISSPLPGCKESPQTHPRAPCSCPYIPALCPPLTSSVPRAPAPCSCFYPSSAPPYIHTPPPSHT